MVPFSQSEIIIVLTSCTVRQLVKKVSCINSTDTVLKVSTDTVLKVSTDTVLKVSTDTVVV